MILLKPSKNVAFLELPQMEMAKPFVKACYRLTGPVEQIIKTALKESILSGPGPCYIDVNRREMLAEHSTPVYSNESLKSTDPINSGDVDAVRLALGWSSRPLLVIGKGCSMSRAEQSVRRLLERLKVPFLPQPMAKGVVSDFDPLCASAARSYALKKADLILLLAARINWQLSVRPNVKVIQVDKDASELTDGVNNSIGICADVSDFCEILHQHVGEVPSWPSWINELAEVKRENESRLEREIRNWKGQQMSHLQALRVISESIPTDSVVVNEGANTMDYGRIVFMHSEPRRRLDAGTLGTMGVGVPFAITSALENPHLKTVCVSGDSAFGFSAMDFDTAARYRLPIMFIVLNNGFIYREREEREHDLLKLSPTAKYEKIAEAFECPGVSVSTIDGLKQAIAKLLSVSDRPVLINVAIDPHSGRPYTED